MLVHMGAVPFAALGGLHVTAASLQLALAPMRACRTDSFTSVSSQKRCCGSCIAPLRMEVGTTSELLPLVLVQPVSHRRVR